MNNRHLKEIYFLVVLLLLPIFTIGQQTEVENQYFLNPWIYNPAEFSDQETIISLSHKAQWSAIEGSPKYSRLAFQGARAGSFYLGGLVKYNEEGPFDKFEGFLSFGYELTFSENTALKLGMSFGYGNRNFNSNELSDPNDVGLLGIADSKSFFQGNTGFSLQISKLKLGAAIPSFFQEQITGDDFIVYSTPTSFLVTAAYLINGPGSSIAFEPQILYHINNNIGINQIEGIGTFYYDRRLWLGGRYRQNYGAGFHVGLKIKNIDASYIHTLSTGTDIGQSSNELVLRLRLGTSKKNTGSSFDLDQTVSQDNTENDLVTAKNSTQESALETTINAQSESDSIQVGQNRPDLNSNKSSLSKNKIEPSHEIQNDVTDLKVTDVLKKVTYILPKGNYIVVGAFEIQSNAIRFNQTLYALGMRNSIIWVPSRKLFYVCVDVLQKEDATQKKLKETRIKTGIDETWVFRVDRKQ
ncbi:MAG: PorP/SprF family type IX secretion system membrane protein [Flavobacteriaceae bacterium]|nr:PorP/SprF family type IX secretion system membrane protein [Flavobacteriaceae bacterium]